jgi:hypothetical protein
MFKQMLAVQWKFSRKAVIAVSLLVAFLPALAMRLNSVGTVNETPRGLVSFSTALGFILAMAAVLIGLILYEASWRSDISGKYVYLLSMPVAWKQVIVGRLSGGLLLLIIPAGCLCIGGIIGTAFVPLPPTLHVYAVGLAVRFFLASSLSYCLWTALIHLSGQKAALVFLIVLLVVIGVPTGLAISGVELPYDRIFRWIADPPSPVSLFFSRWALIDV